VVRAAASLADAAPDGWERLSLAELAQRLGVRTPSLYKHVGGLPALRRELALLGAGELAARLGDAAVGRAAEDAVRAIADAYRRFAQEHPGLYAASLAAPTEGDAEHQAAAARIIDVVMRVLSAFRLEGEDALHAIRLLRSMMHGFVSLDAAGGFGLPLDLDDTYNRLIDLFLLGLERERSA
jgi:AcrR family transcriptional regulator